VVGIALTIVAVAAYALTNRQSQAGPPASPSPVAPQEVQRVTLEDSKAALDNHSAVFLDVRSESAYATSHIPGAVSIPLAELEGRIGELDPEQWIITYCT
jgi:3-mercaptopyruvate sulfurtransferase SseA